MIDSPAVFGRFDECAVSPCSPWPRSASPHSAGPAAAKDWTKVTIATEGAYEPWNFVQPDGKLAGFEIDLAHDLCSQMKVECTVVQNDWDGMIPALNAGKFDAIMAGMSITGEAPAGDRASRRSYAAGPSGFLVSEGGRPRQAARHGRDPQHVGSDEAKAKPIIDGMRALLKGKSIGVQVATIQANFVHHYFDDVAHRAGIQDRPSRTTST